MKKFFWLLAGLAAGLAAGCSDDANEGGGTDGPAPIYNRQNEMRRDQKRNATKLA